MSISNPHILQYLEMVEQGEIVACREQHQLCALVRKCFDEEELTINDDQLTKYLSYQKYFPFDLFPWEVFVFALHCCVYDAQGMPRWPDLLLMVGRGAGKNGYLAFEDFCLLTKTNGIEKYDIDLCATNEEQAKRTFMDIYEVLEGPHKTALSRAFEWNQVRIRNKQTGSILKYRTNNARGKDGLRSGKVDFDEVHEYENYDNIRVFTGGLGKKPHPRRTYATTDGFVRDGVLDDLKNRAAAVLSGTDPDGGLLPFICRLDDKKEAEDERMWHKANPSLRYLPALLSETRKEYAEMSMSASLQSAFMTKRMNLPEGDADIMVTSWENVLACSKPVPIDDLRGCAAIAGIDYAKVTDFASAGILIPQSGIWYWVTHSWLCTNSADLPRMKCPWREWATAGLLTVVDDVEISPSYLVEWIVGQMTHFNILKVALDSFRYGLMQRALAEIGFSWKDRKNVKFVRPSDIMTVSPTIDSKFAKHEIAFGENPLMRWAIHNTKMVRTGINKTTGNMTYGKIEGKSRKTDPFMALVAAATCEPEFALATDQRALDALDVWRM